MKTTVQINLVYVGIALAVLVGVSGAYKTVQKLNEFHEEHVISKQKIDILWDLYKDRKLNTPTEFRWTNQYLAIMTNVNATNYYP